MYFEQNIESSWCLSEVLSHRIPVVDTLMIDVHDAVAAPIGEKLLTSSDRGRGRDRGPSSSAVPLATSNVSFVRQERET